MIRTNETNIQSCLDFLEELIASGFSNGTLRAYKSVLKDFCAFIAGNRLETSLPRLQVLYVEDLQTRGLRHQTINRNISVLKALSRYLGIQCQLRTLQPEKQKELRTLTSDEWSALVQVVKELSDVRDSTIMRLFLELGLRPHELCALNLHDVELLPQGGRLHISGRAKVRHLSIEQGLSAAIEKWLSERHRRHPESDCPALFLSRDAKRLSAYALDQIVRKIGIKARLNVCAMTIRNTFLRRLATAGVPVQQVSAIAGQVSWRYAHRFYAAPPEGDQPAVVTIAPIAASLL